jgi:NAD(P)-dependent dehydrogenase (short-subunit alcohol dehydrogenase family)
MEAFAGRTAVVTGAASGIGRALAERFGALGMRVVLADVEVPRLADVAASMRRAGVDVLPIVTDVADPVAVDGLAAAAFDAYGAVHVLCNNAGVGGGGPIAKLALDDWRWVLGVNLWGVVHGLHAFLPTMLASGEEGHVVNTASLMGMFATPGSGPYHASKYAVVAISEVLHAELAAKEANVSVSVLCPGAVNTDILTSSRNRPASLVAGGSLRDVEEQAELKRMLERSTDPAEVARLVEAAIRTRRLYVFTGPHRQYVEPRFRAILDNFPE